MCPRDERFDGLGDWIAIHDGVALVISAEIYSSGGLMSEKFTIDLVTHDPEFAEFVLYLVEEEEWDSAAIEDRLQRIRKRISKALDVVLDGHLASRFPDSRGSNVRIQVDVHENPPEEFEEFIRDLDSRIMKNHLIQQQIQRCEFVNSLRIVSRRGMGRT